MSGFGLGGGDGRWRRANLGTTAPLQGGGLLGDELTLSIDQATSTTDGYLSQGDWVTFSSKMANPMSHLGALVYGGTSGVPTELEIGATGTVLHGGTTPTWSAVTEADLSFSAVTTADVSTTAHGLCPKLTGSTSAYLRADGSYATPAAIASGYTTASFTGQTSVVVTHNFHAYPIVQVLNGSGLVIAPATLTHNSTDQFTVTFSGSTTGTIVASVGSPQAAAVRSISASGNALITDWTLELSSAGITATMPTAVGATGREITIKNRSSGDVHVAAYSGEQIEGVSSGDLAAGDAVTFYADGVGWWIK